MAGDALMIDGEAIARGGEALAASTSSECCCGTGPCGGGQPSCCQSPNPPGCVQYASGSNTPRRDTWVGGALTVTTYPPDRNCCCGPVAGRYYSVNFTESVWAGEYPTIFAFLGSVTVTASGNPNAFGEIPYHRTVTYANGLVTTDSGLARVANGQQCGLSLPPVTVGTLPPGPGGFETGFPNCTGNLYTWPTAGTGVFSCVPKDGFRYLDCYFDRMDLWSQINLTIPTGTIPYGISHKVYTLGVQPNNSTCMTPCPPRGACCCQGNCFHVTQGECAAMNGQYKGNGTFCYAYDCAALRRCCLPGGFCQDTTRQACYQLGGEWGLPGTSCNKNPCPVAPEVAKCCLPTGVCQMLTQFACLQQNGTWFPGDDCTLSPCQIATTGACCLPNGTCAQITGAACNTQGGTYQGDDTDCQTTGFLCISGACCADFTQHGQTVRECFQSDEFNCLLNTNPVWHGYGTQCTPNLCGTIIIPPEQATGSGRFL